MLTTKDLMSVCLYTTDPLTQFTLSTPFTCGNLLSAFFHSIIITVRLHLILLFSTGLRDCVCLAFTNPLI